MKYQRDLKVLLQERYKRVYRAPYGTYESEVKYLYAFLQKHPVLRGLTVAIRDAVPTFDPGAWANAQFASEQRGVFDWPPTEEERAKLLLALISDWAGGESPEGFGQYVSFESNGDAVLRDVTERVIAPFIDYLQDWLGEDSDVLYLLERYKRRVEWFERERLYAAYTGDTARGEATYDADLRRFLFEQGIDYPFSKPRSASGDADVVAGLEGDDPLVCEVKLYNATTYGVSYLAKGVKQALRYARDYNKVSGHLVVFNLAEETLNLPTDAEGKPWPPRLHVGDHVIYLVVVQALPLPSASVPGKLTARDVTREALLAAPDA